MNNKLKDALSISKTKLESGWYVNEPWRPDYQSQYNDLKVEINRFVKMLDFEYKSCIENGKATKEYLYLNEQIEELTKKLKWCHERLRGGTKETWQSIRKAVLEAYTSYPEAYNFLRNQMAIVKVLEDENSTNYLYRNYAITKQNNGKKYLAYPNLKMQWYGFDKDLSKELWKCEADTLYQVKYKIDKNVMSIFAEKTGLINDL